MKAYYYLFYKFYKFQLLTRNAPEADTITAIMLTVFAVINVLSLIIFYSHYYAGHKANLTSLDACAKQREKTTYSFNYDKDQKKSFYSQVTRHYGENGKVIPGAPKPKRIDVEPRKENTKKGNQ
jgi:hypothetical protein